MTVIFALAKKADQRNKHKSTRNKVYSFIEEISVVNRNQEVVFVCVSIIANRSNNRMHDLYTLINSIYIEGQLSYYTQNVTIEFMV